MTKKEVKKIIKEIVNEIELDRTKDHLENLIGNQQVKTKLFKIDEMEYKVTINEIIDENTNQVLLSTFSFINVTAGKNTKKEPDESLSSYAERLHRTKVGLTGTGNQMRVFNEIYNIFIKYIEKFHPKFVGYEAIENNRQKLYDTLIKRAVKQIGGGIKFKKLDKNPITKEINNPMEFNFEVEYI